jgi:hypothetical protein
VKLIRYTSEFELDGEARSVTYYRAFDATGQKREDELNKQHADDIAAYAAACDLGMASKVSTTYEVVDA